MTLADYETRCKRGPLGSVSPIDEMAAIQLVQALAAEYRDRLAAHSAEWHPKKKERRRSGIENSLPKGDRL